MFILLFMDENLLSYYNSQSRRKIQEKRIKKIQGQEEIDSFLLTADQYICNSEWNLLIQVQRLPNEDKYGVKLEEENKFTFKLYSDDLSSHQEWEVSRWGDFLTFSESHSLAFFQCPAIIQIVFSIEPQVYKDSGQCKLIFEKSKRIPCDYVDSEGVACCGRFTEKRSLQRHKVLHSGKRPFICDMPGCVSAFARNSALRLHISRVHHREKPFLCGECDALYAHKQSLKNHLHKKHPEMISTV